MRSFFWSLVVLGALLVLQSTLLGGVIILQAKLNILWLVFIAICLQNGSIPGQLVGFILGLAVDSVTASPVGLHAFEFSLAGYLFGLGRGKIFFDAILMPALLGMIAVLFDVLTLFLLNFIFRLGLPVQSFFYWGVLAQMTMGAIFMPAIFWIYRWSREHFSHSRRGFSGS